MQKKNHFRGEPSREQIRETQKKKWVAACCGHNRQPYKIWARLQSVSITQVWPDQDVNLQQAMLLTSSFFFVPAVKSSHTRGGIVFKFEFQLMGLPSKSVLPSI